MPDFVIPVINKDLTMLKKDFDDRIEQPKYQRNLVLIIVCIALLLDNMLYMVIVPIIPEYLRSIDEANEAATSTTATTINIYNEPSLLFPNLTTTKRAPAGRVRNKIDTTTILTTTYNPDRDKASSSSSSSSESQDIKIGFLFASKAMVQLVVNPFSGAFIDKVGYDKPMCIGLFIIFLSTLLFSIGNSYFILFLARSLQGVGSAFADTSGLAMIADRFTEEGERSKALGIALAFISFGSLVAPPFGGVVYSYLGKRVPFVILALIALVDGIMLFFVMKPHRNAMVSVEEPGVNKPKGTPIWKLFQDPYIAVNYNLFI
jgi:MFS transporter, DHA1 family, solute carrier family 18 (vesicular acetylcholine transporter), member 3